MRTACERAGSAAMPLAVQRLTCAAVTQHHLGHSPQTTSACTSPRELPCRSTSQASAFGRIQGLVAAQRTGDQSLDRRSDAGRCSKRRRCHRERLSEGFRASKSKPSPPPLPPHALFCVSGIVICRQNHEKSAKLALCPKLFLPAAGWRPTALCAAIY